MFLFQKEAINPWVLVIISSLLLVLPFFVTSFPPSTDLPQHLAQLYLLTETLQGNTDLFSINWFAPNNLIYLLLIGLETIFDPPLTGKVLLVILVLMWVSSTYFLAWKFQRPLENAALVTLFVFNLSFYWGFLSFLIGWPFFALLMVQDLKPISKKNWLLTFVLLVLLLSSHALWFLLGAIYIFIQVIFYWKDWQVSFYKISPLIPIGIVSIVWFQSLSVTRSASGFDTAPHWFFSPIDRLMPEFFLDFMLGGIRGNLEFVIAGALFLWVILALYTNYGQLKQKVDSKLLLGAALFLSIVLFAPDKYMNTVFFANRWLPFVMIMLVLALPKPVFNPRLLAIYIIGLVALFSVETTRMWMLFDKYELSGLRSSLEALPNEQRVLGLDFIKTSEFIKGRPFLQTFAYTQAVKGGSINFSFAEHHSGIVHYKQPRMTGWTPNLDWYAERVTPEDFQFFDYALVNATDDLHLRLSSRQDLQVITEQGKWRLYQIK
ncbi:hypothetical protein [Candidatus Albibeggiatoa sp. nov. NOAA]|uniref:hypothetical protein n=1 Tax=Candidatus Albibeggiatoa sp. nov. NOAA TaxID=3162724 RepID=UPI0032F9E8FC|nr:hypothetical protein [Thiotrichaceae bacterium]